MYFLIPSLTPMLLLVNLSNTNDAKNLKITETLAYGYSVRAIL